MTDLNNPMRFSLRSQHVDLDQYDVDVTELTVRPAEGNLYVHWTEGDDE